MESGHWIDGGDTAESEPRSPQGSELLSEELETKS